MGKEEEESVMCVWREGVEGEGGKSMGRRVRGECVRCTEGVTCEGEGVWWGGSVVGWECGGVGV